MLDAALEANPDSTPLRACLLARKAELDHFTGHAVEAEEASRQGLEAARESGDPQAIGAALVGRWYACMAPGGLPERRELTRELLEVSGDGYDREVEIVAWRLNAVLALETGDAPGLEVAIEEHRRLAERRKNSRAKLQNRRLSATRALLRGDVPAAEQVTAELLQPGLVAGLAPGALLLVIVRWEMERIGEMEDALRELAARFASPEWKAALALLLAETGEHDESSALLGTLLKADGQSDEPPLSSGALALSALAVAALPEPEHAERVTDLLRDYAGQGALAGVGTAYLGPIDHHIGVLATLSGDHSVASTHLQAAREFDTRSGAALWAGRTERALERLEMSAT